MIILFNRKMWEDNNFNKFTKEQLDEAEKRSDGFIGYFDGCKCVLSEELLDDVWRIAIKKDNK